MRKLLITAAVTVAALAVTAVAIAATQQHYIQTFSTKKASKPAGTLFHADSSDPNNPNNHQPANTKEIDIIFPKGAKVNTKALPVCKASDSALESQGPTACKANTQVGHFKGGCQGATTRLKNCSGKATARLPYNGGGDIPVRVYAFNGPNNKLVLANYSSVKNFVIRAAVTVTKNPVKIIAKVPLNCVLGTPPSCGPHHETARLNKFDLTIDKIAKPGKPVFITTPKSCPKSKNWVFSATFKYVSNSLNTTAGPNTFAEPSHVNQETKTSKSACS